MATTADYATFGYPALYLVSDFQMNGERFVLFQLVILLTFFCVVEVSDFSTEKFVLFQLVLLLTIAV
jgi:hypothetical protein